MYKPRCLEKMTFSMHLVCISHSSSALHKWLNLSHSPNTLRILRTILFYRWKLHTEVNWLGQDNAPGKSRGGTVNWLQSQEEPSSIQYCLSLIKHGFSLRSLLSTFLPRSNFLWAVLKTAALKQPGNACEPFRQVKCPKSRVIHGLVSKQQSRGGRAGAGSRARAITAGRRAAPRRGGLWSGGLGSVPELVAAESTCVPDGADPGQALGVSEASWTHTVEVAEKDSEPAQEEAVITKKPKIRGDAGCPCTR